MKRKCPKCNRTLAIAGSGSFYDANYVLNKEVQKSILYCMHCIKEDQKSKMPKEPVVG